MVERTRANFLWHTTGVVVTLGARGEVAICIIGWLVEKGKKNQLRW
jgi:hypothetical protein